MKKDIYTSEEMQERLADYCLDTLNVEEKIIFERSLEIYPEFKEEIEQINSAFGKNIKNDFNEMMERKAVNVSVKVNEKLDAGKSNTVFTYFKYFAPVIGVVILFLIINNIDNTKNNESLTKNSLKNQEIISDKNIDEDDVVDFINAGSLDIGFSDIDDSEIYDKEAIDDLFDDIDRELAAQSIETDEIYFNENEIYSILSELDENDFITILKELKNAKIAS